MERQKSYLIAFLQSLGISGRVLDAISRVPRHMFMPKKAQRQAYDDTPVPIGDGQTISAPSMVAIMCDVLDIRNGDKVLEIGTGWGYHAAVMSILAGSGTVYTVERIPDLAEKAASLFKELGFDNIEAFISDGSEGLSEFSPYDRISVAASAPEIPQPLIEQLAENGRMVIPVGQYFQELYLVEKKDGIVNSYPKGGVAFVPLLGKYGFR